MLPDGRLPAAAFANPTISRTAVGRRELSRLHGLPVSTVRRGILFRHPSRGVAVARGVPNKVH